MLYPYTPQPQKAVAHLQLTIAKFNRPASTFTSALGLLRKALQWLMPLWLLLSLALGASQALAQSTVAGTITGNTTLRAAQSPYIFQGDVVLDNNATLSIEPGVLVQMAPAASFTLKKGALQAVGTPEQPIKITSAAAAPAAGDWHQWRFTPGTNNALTQLGHISIEYGSGVVIEGASPVINNAAINHHSGPAITMDLASSPVGTGNTASGNALNAIVVPSGTIRSQVVWAVVGIPYLLQQGLVNVGQAPLALEPARLKLAPGVVALLRVTLNAPAASGGVTVDVTSSVPSVASAVSRVTVPQGQTSADLEVLASSLGSTQITASHATLGVAQTQVDVVNLPSLALVPANPTVGVNRSYPMTVSLPAPASANVAVQLGNADPAILTAPASLVVPAGQQSLNFEVTGLADGTSRLSAQAEGYASALATVAVRGKALVLPTSVVVAPGGSTTVTLEATEPAPAGGLSVGLSLAHSTLAQIPASVQIDAGQSKVAFTIDGTTLGTTTLTATASGYQSGQTTLRVDAISLNTEPAADLVMNEEQTRMVRVQLSKVAPQGGITVSLNSQDPAIATVSPAQVFVPQGQIYATVPVAVRALAEGATAISITSPGLIAKTLDVQVRQKFALQLVRQGGGSKVVVGKGLTTYNYSSDTREVRVQRLINGVPSAGAEPVEVSLRCAAEDVCTAPATVTIPAGQSTVSVPVTGVDVGSTELEATAQGATAAVPMPVEVIEPQVKFEYLDETRTTASVRDDFRIRLSVPGAYYDYQTAATALTVQLGLVDQNPAGVVNGIYDRSSGGNLITQLTIPQGRQAYSDMAYVAQPSAAGTYRVSAQVPGITSGTSAVQTVTAAEQALQLVRQGGDKVVVGKGLTTYNYSSDTREVRVQRLINGVVKAGAEPVEVSLRCAAEDVCTAPATVTIPAGQSAVSVTVTGVDVGTTELEATAQGTTAAVPMPVEVIEPQVVFDSLDTTRTTASVRDDFRIRLSVPGAYYDYQTAATALTVQLGLVDQNPAGVVNGIYDRSSGGNLITQLTIPQGRQAYSDMAYVAQPSAAGTYRVSAQVPGITSGTSAVQTVTAAEQALQLVRQGGDKVVVGKGLTTYNYSSDTREVRVQRLINGVVKAGAEPVEVSLRCAAEDVCTAPATVTIPAGQSAVSVTVTGVDVGTTELEATAQGTTAAVPMPVEVIEPQVKFEYLDETRTTASVRDDFRIRLSVPGAYYDYQTAATALTVQLGLVDQNPAGVVNGIYDRSSGGNLITQLTIPQGRQAYSDMAYVAQPSAAGTYRVSAQVPGITSGTSAVQTVTAAEQALQLVRQGGDKVVVGKGLTTYNYSSDTREVRVQRLINGVVKAGAEPVEVSLRCAAEDVCTAPATVTIPAGQSTVSVTVTGVEVGSTQLEATAVGHDASYLTVETISPLLRLHSVPDALAVGQSYQYVYVNAEVPGAYYATSQYPAADLPVTLTSSVPSVGSITSAVTWRANSSYSGYATFSATAPGSTQITASSAGFVPASSAAITVNP